MRRRRHKAQMQVAAAILLALATATTVVAINTTANYTSNITDLLPLKITDYFSKTIEIWTMTSLELDENLRIWLRLDNGTTIKETPIFVNYSSGNLTENLNVSTNLEGFYPLNLSPGNYTIQASFEGHEYYLPSLGIFEIEVRKNKIPLEESVELNLTIEDNLEIVKPIEHKESLLNVIPIISERPTRGQNFEITLNITNYGNANAKNVIISWTLSNDLFLVSESKCSSIKSESSCLSKNIFTSYSNTTEGQREIKVVINYD